MASGFVGGTRVELPGISKLKNAVKGWLAPPMDATGQAIVAEARRLVHIKTGQTHDSISYTYRQDTMTLTIHADTPWAAFLELGTSRSRPYPYLRPALSAGGKMWGLVGTTEVMFANTPTKYAAGMAAKGRAAFGRKARVRTSF